jgi:hypothetical protein
MRSETIKNERRTMKQVERLEATKMKEGKEDKCAIKEEEEGEKTKKNMRKSVRNIRKEEKEEFKKEEGDHDRS